MQSSSPIPRYFAFRVFIGSRSLILRSSRGSLWLIGRSAVLMGSPRRRRLSSRSSYNSGRLDPGCRTQLPGSRLSSCTRRKRFRAFNERNIQRTRIRVRVSIRTVNDVSDHSITKGKRSFKLRFWIWTNINSLRFKLRFRLSISDNITLIVLTKYLLL